MLFQATEFVLIQCHGNRKLIRLIRYKEIGQETEWVNSTALKPNRLGTCCSGLLPSESPRACALPSCTHDGAREFKGAAPSGGQVAMALVITRDTPLPAS